MALDEMMLRKGMQFNTLQDDILYKVLVGSELAQELTGCIRKGIKPTDVAPVTREDCTISSLALPAGSVQLGTSHVNIIIPDLTDCTAPGAQTLSADTARIKLLAELAYKCLEKHYCENGWAFTWEQQDVIAEPELHAHRLWIKIRFNFHNV